MDQLLRRLLSQAYLFDDPNAYAAGVRDAFEVLARQHPAEDAG